MDSGASSLLLHCLARLGQDTVAQVLLPKLLEQGSGPALAATCSQLRVLVHSSITCLALKWFYEAWTGALPNHFPSCNHVSLITQFPAASHSMPYVISALARLPNLDAISIKAQFTELPVVALSTVLYCMRMQLTGLKSLTLDLQQCEATGLGYIWQELGRAPQLTALTVELTSPMQEGPDNYLKDAAALSALQRLQVLRVADWCTEEQHTVDWSFVSCLTAVTELALSSRSRPEGEAAVGSCTPLRNLTLKSAGQPPFAAALAQLTALTRLDLQHQWVGADCACAQALGCLKHLRWLGAGVWEPELLPVLQGLPQLSTISGDWYGDAVQLGSLRLPQVCTLLDAGGPMPLEAFPQLVCLQLRWAIPPGVLLKLAACCPQLQELQFGFFCRYRCETAAATQGLQSLSGLQQLQHLQLEVCDEVKLVAAASAVRVLGQGSLKMLHLSVKGCRFSSLLVLSNLAGLDVLHLVLWEDLDSAEQHQEVVRVEDAGLLLLGLSGVRKVMISCPDEQMQAALRAAPAWAAERGLPVVCEVDVVVR